MKTILILALLILAGCQSAPPVTPAVTTEPPPAVSSAPAAPSPTPLERKVRQQAQYIDALLSQNSALAAKLAAAAQPPAAVPVPFPALVPVVPVAVASSAPAPVSESEPTLSPNADGIIDLTAPTVTPGEPVNPFMVRSGTAEGVREILLHVSGIIAGPRACAVINERLMQAGDSMESFTVERIDSDAVTLRQAAGRLRLPLAEKPVRVRVKS